MNTSTDKQRNPEDSDLLRECLGGSRDAWHRFVERFSKLIYHSINKTLQSYACNLQQEDIEDIFNGIFLSIIENNYKKLRQFEGKKGCTLSSWIRLITIRHTIDFLRGQKEYVSIDSETDFRPMVETIKDNNPSVEYYLQLSQTEMMLKKSIEALPSPDRLFMELYYGKELPPEEIAVIMNVSVGTIYSKKNRIREKLEKSLKSI